MALEYSSVITLLQQHIKKKRTNDINEVKEEKHMHVHIPNTPAKQIVKLYGFTCGNILRFKKRTKNQF